MSNLTFIIWDFSEKFKVAASCERTETSYWLTRLTDSWVSSRFDSDIHTQTFQRLFSLSCEKKTTDELEKLKAQNHEKNLLLEILLKAPQVLNIVPVKHQQQRAHLNDWRLRARCRALNYCQAAKHRHISWVNFLIFSYFSLSRRHQRRAFILLLAIGLDEIGPLRLFVNNSWQLCVWMRFEYARNIESN